jgi:hypothetical protein
MTAYIFCFGVWGVLWHHTQTNPRPSRPSPIACNVSGVSGEEYTNNDAPTVSSSIVLHGSQSNVVKVGNDTVDCCRVYKTVTPHCLLTLTLVRWPPGLRLTGVIGFQPCEQLLLGPPSGSRWTEPQSIEGAFTADPPGNLKHTVLRVENGLSHFKPGPPWVMSPMTPHGHDQPGDRTRTLVPTSEHVMCVSGADHRMCPRSWTRSFPLRIYKMYSGVFRLGSW